ncbi:MAG: L-threonylcarbamoyladenylate synthase [Phycisphaerae bacterium]
MQTLIITDISPDSPELARAAAIIRNGGLVAFPTETVYGIAARADSKTVEKLSVLKDRSEGKYYSLHIARPEDLADYVPYISRGAKKLVDNLWPGPLTLVFSIAQDKLAACSKRIGKKYDWVYHNSSVGVRCPDNPIASRLLELAGVPVVATSANISGEPPAVEGVEVIRQFDGLIDAIIDDGKCEEALSSTVAMVGSSGVNVLRQGSVSAEEIRDISMLRIAFLCDSNLLCGRVAELLCKSELAAVAGCSIDELPSRGYSITSAGVKVIKDMPVDPIVVEFAAAFGEDLEGVCCRAVSETDLASDVIFVMEQSQKQRIVEFYPHLEDRCILLAGDRDLCEPDRESVVFDEFVRLVRQFIRERLEEL